MNKEISEQLGRLLKYYTSMSDKGRMFGYRRALTSLNQHTDPIYDIDQLDNIPNIGKGIRDKVKEYMAEGHIKRFDFIDTDDKVKAIQLLESVWGVGPAKAKELYAKGIRTIADLRKKQDLITDMQKIGLKYHEDFIERIPREEIALLLERFRKTANKIIPNGEKLL